MERAFLDWLSKSKSGNTFTYHVGLLMKDRLSQTKFGVVPTEANWIGNKTLQAYNEGRVHLVQRRLGDGQYEYIAVRR